MPLAFELGLTPKDVMIAIEAYMGLAAKQLKKNGSVKVGNMFNLKLKVIPARRARKGVRRWAHHDDQAPPMPSISTIIAHRRGDG